MPAKNTLIVTKTATILDRSTIAGLSNAQLCETILAINPKQPLLVIDNADGYFTPDNLITMIANKDPAYKLINDQIGFFTEAQLKALIGGNPKPMVNAKVVDADDGGVVVQKGGYNYAEVPAGWSIGADCSLGLTKIRRKRVNPQGDGVKFCIMTVGYEAFAKAAIAFWSKTPGATNLVKVETGDGVRTCTFGVDHVVCGFNNIRRYEVEQIAKYRGWVGHQGLIAA